MLDRGEYLGPLHGIPYGAKDLLAVQGAPTTWGATPYQDQVLDETATVVASSTGRSRAGGQAHPGRPGLGRRVVRRHDPQPLEY